MDSEKWVEYLLLYSRNELSAEQYAELKQWIEEDEKHKEIFRQTWEVYRSGRRVACAERMVTEKAWHNISQRLAGSRRQTRIWTNRWLRYAAVFLLLIPIGMYYVGQYASSRKNILAYAHIMPGRSKAILRLSDGREFMLQKDTSYILTEKNGTRIEAGGERRIVYHASDSAAAKVFYNTVIVPRGGEYSLLLSDGSRVWLNAGSQLTYPVVFGTEEREVKLKGEAFFEVTADSSKPFIVKSWHNRVEVLGTRFNVSAYEEGGKVKTTLLKGSVKISNGQKQLLLYPGQQAICEENQIEVFGVDVESVAAWMKGIFEFENLSLGEITDQLERWYDVDFVYHNPALREITFTGAATRYRELSFLLDMIGRLAEVDFVVRGNIIQVMAK